MKNYFKKLLVFLITLSFISIIGQIEVNAAPDQDYFGYINDFMKLTPQVSLNVGYGINDTENNTALESYSITKTNNKNNLSMQVVLNVDWNTYNEFYKQICEIAKTPSKLCLGYIYCLTSSLPEGETITSLLFEDKTYHYDLNGKKIKDNITLSTYNYIHSNCFTILDLAKVNSDLFTSVTNTNLSQNQYAQYGFLLSNISLSKIDTKISVVFFYQFSGYALTNERIISVKSIANTYINAEDTSSYTEHLGVLSWLANKNSN